MTSRFSNKFPIPEGFPEILHDFAKEVVRYHPNDIFDFAIQYFNSIEIERPLNYIPGGSANIERREETIKEEKKKEEIKKEEILNEEKSNEEILNEDNINEENNKEENIKEENIKEENINEENNDESAKDFVDDIFKKSMHFVKNSQENFKEEEENIEENNLNEQENLVLESENNERLNDENIAFGKTIMNTQGSDSRSNSRLYSASSISNNSELRKTAHQFIGDLIKKGNEDTKNNENI